VGRRAVAVPVTTSAVVRDRQSLLLGYSLSCVAGGTVTIYDNPTTASGNILAIVTLAANTTATQSILDGVSAATGIYFNTTSACTGSVWVG
jgi:hypothetical protein